MEEGLSIVTSSTPSGYQSQSIDTTIEADRLRFRLYRQRSPLERLQLAARFRQQARQLSLNCLQQNFAQLDGPGLASKVAQAWLADKCPPDWFPRLDAMNWSQDPLAIAALISRILTEAQVVYYVTGGVAAIAHGEPRATLDLDIVISIPLSSLPPLVATLEAAGFYVAGLADALSGKLRCLNATHLETIENIDLMLADDSEYEQLKFERRQWYQLATGESIAIATPEDIIISKLQWRRRSQSDKQWRDILGILKVQQERLDLAYIDRWTERFQLQEDWRQAGLEGGVGDRE
jgi:hypothetical protein